ncbi:hypothetical protein [Phycicoccus duodecadis]|uniref:Uncharacterized protein n=1 Tax=Phycicoccus duodecadis TaxID=173053 RepID=A0A2N3YHH9_9MICO|nr:hypothetical protein [Phycicoccus duodecadis]PKW26296.1 hypothetical protein ATL31_1103 [Phycicoccus duodecadis]
MRTRPLLLLGLALSVLAALVCLVAPLYAAGDGSGGATLAAVNGPGALVAPALFVVFALGAATSPWRGLRLAGVAAHAALTLLALLTIGAFFLPATTALVLGALHALRASPAPAGAPQGSRSNAAA